MTQRSFIVVAAVVATLIIGAVAAFVYDSSRDDRIADGVTIAGVHVGGLDRDEARDVVRRRVASNLDRPLIKPPRTSRPNRCRDPWIHHRPHR